jgi:transcriptional regulator with XRE-family HTH domain
MTVTTKPPVAANLRSLKERKGVTWQAIARELDVGERLVSAWARDDESVPSWWNVCRLAEFFGVEPALFYHPPEFVELVIGDPVESVPVDHFLRVTA